MGRHSRKGPAPKGAGTPGAPGALPGARDAETPGGGRRRRPAEQHASPASGTPGSGAPARGGHPEHHEGGGGWGDWQTGAGPQVRTAPPPAPAAPRIPGPRREFVEAFDGPEPAAGPLRAAPGDDGPDQDAGPAPQAARGGRGRAFTGVAAAAVTTVLAVIVAGQVTEDRPDDVGSRAAGQERGAVQERPDRSEGRATPQQEAQAPAAPAPTYAQLMAARFPIDPGLEGPGEFEAVPGLDKAPGKGRKIRYRIDVEKGLGLDAGLFARAVQETLNDDRSWAHGGAMTFERVSSGEAKFVITLASPGTTGVWCAKSGLDTTVDNVSCDSASTERVMINAYRWAQGAETYGPKAMLAYRQMLINHEVGHRLGHNHVNCTTPGALAPVMQQQTKSLDVGGVSCRANPWVHPGD
ncbi:DUF3152 domain-containing protein [Streptomyces genisteinicus]|uniref:DUF3152 domain-containing protein n=1 Tax=Streptomyces genisteinicus TaxID=2768068 RepID=A0A7H0HXB7_9ACTN|nr:DUF3152 domain-containing protein [Streptomyces genisteinicus]QNP65183.1 DUF3152 domain-containing protein [Streptomyces genisteinicus]